MPEKCQRDSMLDYFTNLFQMKAREEKCQKDSMLDYFDRYTKTTCKLDCKSQFIARKCGCKEVHIPTLRLNATTYNSSFISYSTNFGNSLGKKIFNGSDNDETLHLMDVHMYKLPKSI